MGAATAPLRSLSPFRLGLGLGRVRSKAADRSVRPTQDDFGVEQRCRRRGGDQVAMAVEDFDLAARESSGRLTGRPLRMLGYGAEEMSLSPGAKLGP